MKDYKRLTKWSELGTLHVFDINGKEIPLCDVSPIDTDNLAGRLADLEDKIESGEIDYVTDRDKKIARLTAENENLTVELEVAQRDVENLARTLEGANEEIKALEAENSELRETLSKMETVEKELRARLENAVELPRIIHPNPVEWHIQYQYESGIITEDIRFSEAEAEARLKELQGGER